MYDGRSGYVTALTAAILAVACPVIAAAQIDLSMRDLLATGDVVEGFGRIGGADSGEVVTGGIENVTCMAADGRVAVVATSTDARRGLLCGDATGFRNVASVGDPAPDGGRFARFWQCALPDDGSVLIQGLVQDS